MNSNRLIVVLGMHRSGTSAITRGLQAMNVELGNRLMPPVEGINAKGFWEDIDLTDLNVKMLDELGLDWHYLIPISDSDVEVLRKKGYFLKAVELLREKIGDSPIYGFKDPRVSKLLPFWKAVFAHCELDTSYILALRHPLSVVKSLAKRDDFDAEKSYLLWLEHTLTSLAISTNEKRVVIDFDRLMQLPEYELRRVASNLALDINLTELEHYKDTFLDHGLRSTVYHLNDLLCDDACPPIVREVYTALLEVASDKAQLDSPLLQNKVAQWLNEFTRLKSPLLLIDKLSSEKALSDKLLTQRDKQIADFSQTVDECNKLINSLNKAAAEQGEDLNQVIAERDGLVSNLHQLEQQLAKALEVITEIRASNSWKITAPLRYVASRIKNTIKTFRKIRHIIQSKGGVFATTRKAIRILSEEGFTGIRLRLKHEANHVSTILDTNVLLPSVGSKLSIVPYYIDPRLVETPINHSPKASIAIHLHIFDMENLDQAISYLAGIPLSYDIYVSAPATSDVKELTSLIEAKLPCAEKIVIEQVPNRGQDIAPLIIQFGARLSQYDLIAHLHTDNAQACASNQDTVDKLLSAPGGSGGHVLHIIELLQQSAKIVYAESSSPDIKDSTGWSNNYALAQQLLKTHTQLSIDDFPEIEFPEQSMFWARTDCLRDFLALPLKYSDFPPESARTDGTLTQALKRLILVFASQHEGQSIRIHHGDSIHDYRHYEEQRDYTNLITHNEIKILSYYLPQFHPTPENDEWHGEGFTEWTKVRAANPLFEGHYQQHIPHPDIGYYLLDSPETLRQQADMMSKSGVYGQVFYHYWFSGKLILEEPVKMLLANSDIEMPFCFCWANENWTRRWDGNEKEILLGQNYSPEDARAFIQYLIPFFQDSRYITVDERPVLFVYRPSSMPDPREYLSIWESECAAAGLKRPYVVAVLTRGATHPDDFGMDAGTERVLHDWTDGAVPNIKETLRPYHPINGSVLDYNKVAKFYRNQTSTKDFTYFRSLSPTWDNTARYGSEAILLHDSTPLVFQEWLQDSIRYAQLTLPSDRRFILVNAWNEWAEGAHLEPDTRFGYSYLNSIGRALSDIDYAESLYSNYPLIANTQLHLQFTESALTQLRADPSLKERFLFCLSRSSVFKTCSVISINTDEFTEQLPRAILATPKDAASANFTLQFRHIALFEPTVLENMLHTAGNHPESGIISNAYGIDEPVMSMTENGSVEGAAVSDAPLILLHGNDTKLKYKNFRIRSDAHTFVSYPNAESTEKLPVVTTIIRFHKTGDIRALRNALYCLAAMHECVVIPMIAAQDLSEIQSTELESLLQSIPWAKGFAPITHHFHSLGGTGDLRSKMLNESLRKVKTRYAAFLDFDDLLMPNAYSWLIGRLNTTGKAVSFGRVYSAVFDGATEMILERKRNYEYGSSYEEFVSHNHAPVHSFMLDLHQFNLGNVTYFEDQRYMEDYLLTLQLFKRGNTDWESLRHNVYIGDYIHSIHRSHTLAFTDETDRKTLLQTPEYQICEQRIKDIRKIIT